MDVSQELVKYEVTDAVIAEMKHQYMGLIVKDPDDAEGFTAAHNARMIVKGARVGTEKKRKELKADALAYGKSVDGEAKRITALLRPIEDHLIAQEKIVTDEKERQRQAEEDAERARLDAIEREKREEEEAKVRAERAVEEQKLQEERERLAKERAAMQAEQERYARVREAEDKKLADERERIEAEQKIERERLAQERETERLAREKQFAAERERLAAIEAAQKAEADKIMAMRRRIAGEEYERQRVIEIAKAREEAAAQAKADAERQAVEDKAREEEQRQLAALQEAEAKRNAEQEQQRLDAMRPDIEKIRAYGQALFIVPLPKVEEKSAKRFLAQAVETIQAIGNRCMAFEAPAAKEGEPCTPK